MSSITGQRPARTYEPLGPDETPPLGAHLVSPRWGFAHHGIYTGGGKVVHYGALLYDLVRRPVEEVPLEAFAQGRPVFLIRHAEACRDPVEVISSARSRLGENRYSVWTNNCEHFCEWCLHGEPRSFQVEDALEFPRRIAEWAMARLSGAVQALLATPIALRLGHETANREPAGNDVPVVERMRRE